MARRIYLDHNATTPVAPGVAEVASRALREVSGNPSSAHSSGAEARAWVERARREVAELIGAAPEEIVFTGGGSEANNLALKGVAWRRGRGRIITQVTEHPSVLAPLAFLERQGFEIVRLPVDGRGAVRPEDVEAALTADTILVTIQHANNETGTLQPIAAISEAARRAGVPVHTDAAQSVGKLPVRVDALGVALLTIAGHKLRAPKGVGALWVRSDVALEPLVHGAGHEAGRRAGTEAVHQMAALGEACRLARAEDATARLRERRDLLHRLLADAVPGLVLHGHPDERLPNTLNLGFPGARGADLLAATPGVEASTGSACHAGEVRLSPVLEAMGIGQESGAGAVRLSLGKETTEDDVRQAAERLIAAYRKLAQ